MTTSIGRLNRYILGNVNREGVEHCAQAVRNRAKRERKNHRGVTMLVSDTGDVYAPDSESITAEFVHGLYPWWEVCRYQFTPPKAGSGNARWNPELQVKDETTPTAADIAEDIVFHVDHRTKKAA